MMNFWSALYRRKRSVRLQLLVMALVPLMVLLPVLLVMGISRWNNDYNNLLIAKVESELQVAEQYLQRIVGATGTSVEALAASLAIQKAAENGQLNDFLTLEKDALGLDFLSIVQPTSIDEHMQKWPVVQSALTGTARTAVDLFEAEDLLMIDVALAEHLCAVADGRFDAFVDFDHEALGPWDYLGGMLVCRESGVDVVDAFGRELEVLDHNARRTPVAAVGPALEQLVAARSRELGE